MTLTSPQRTALAALAGMLKQTMTGYHTARALGVSPSALDALVRRGFARARPVAFYGSAYRITPAGLAALDGGE